MTQYYSPSPTDPARPCVRCGLSLDEHEQDRDLISVLWRCPMPRTETGQSLADGETDGLTAIIRQIELEAVALVAPRAVVINWISIGGGPEVDIDVIVSGGRALVGEQTLRLMAESIRTSEIASDEEDAAYADAILATERRSDGFYDVTDEPALSDSLIEYGVGRATDFEASL